MKKINFGVRFNLANAIFIIRFILALFIPILTYFGLEQQDLTSWNALGRVLLDALSNPFVVGFTIINALNLIPDPTTEGIWDSQQALSYKEPRKEDENV